MSTNNPKIETGINPTQNYDNANTGINFKDFSATGLGAQMGSLGQAYIDMNYTDWTQGDDYASLTKRYSEKGRQAMDDTIGQMAARTGGLASSYAATAGQQAYGSWMEKLEDAARSLYDSQKSEALNAYNVAAGDFDRQRGIYESDRGFEYGKYRDGVNDAKWKDEKVTDQANKDREWDYKLATDEEQDLYDELYYNSGAYKNYEAYQNAHPDTKITKATFDRIKSTAAGAYADDHSSWIESGSNNVKNTIINGGSLDWATWSQTTIGKNAIAAGYTEKQFNADVKDATNQKNNGDKATKDKEYTQIFSDPDFLWGDWDGDGEVEGAGEDKTFDEAYGGSSHDEEFWKSIYDDAQRKNNDPKVKETQDKILTMWSNGVTPTTEQLVAAGWANENGTLNELGQAYFNKAIESNFTNDVFTYLSINEIDESTTWDNFKTSYEADGGKIPTNFDQQDFEYIKQGIVKANNFAESGTDVATFYKISADDAETYIGWFENAKTTTEAYDICERIVTSSGNSEFAYALYYQWLANNQYSGIIGSNAAPGGLYATTGG